MKNTEMLVEKVLTELGNYSDSPLWNEHKPMYVLDKEKGFLIGITNYHTVLGTNRVPEFVVVIKGNLLDNIATEMGLKSTYYGEIPMLRLFEKIMERDSDEQFVCDTDVLSWDFKAGNARDYCDLGVTLGEWNRHLYHYIGEGLEELFVSDPNEMPTFLTVRLYDYMS